MPDARGCHKLPGCQKLPEVAKAGAWSWSWELGARAGAPGAKAGAWSWSWELGAGFGAVYGCIVAVVTTMDEGCIPNGAWGLLALQAIVSGHSAFASALGA